MPQYTAEGIRIDCLDAGMSGKKFVYDGTENVNPFYLSSLPAVIPGDDVTGIPLQIFYTPYLFNKIEGGWDTGWEWVPQEGDNYLYYGTTATKDDIEYSIYIVYNKTN